MAAKIFFTHVLFILKCVLCRVVNPPQDLVIRDPGHLGNLEISWSPSQEHIWMKEQGQCSVLYEPHYYDSYNRSWTSIRTSQTSFRAQFDLAQEVKVCVYTVISGECAGGSSDRSKNCSEVNQKPDRTGVVGIQNLTCVYYNMEHIVCKWKRNSKMPSQSQEALYFWHSELAHASECPHYIISEGHRSACNFSGTELPTFSDINLCVNASSSRPVRTVYSSMQIQNIVKPEASGEVHVEAGPDGQLTVHWDGPTGKIPPHCLQWEVQEERESYDGTHTLRKLTSTETALKLSLPNNESTCLSVRSRLNKYCASSGLWSDWSPLVCYPDTFYIQEELYLAPEPRSDVFPEYMFLPVIIAAALVLALCVGAAVALRRSREVVTKNSSFGSLSDKSSEPCLPVAQHV